MPSLNQDDLLLLIRCPSCGQRFKVGEDLRGRTVECGGCEHRFHINDSVIVRGKKFYPGERKDGKLNRFQRVPLAIAPESASLVPMRYAEAPDPTLFEPVAPQRIIAGAVSVVLIVGMALLLMFGAGPGGVLDGMTTFDRQLMAGFTGLLGTVLLGYANPRARIKSVGLGVVLSGGLLVLPYWFNEGSVPLSEVETVSMPTPAATAAGSGESAAILELRKVINTAPLVKEMEKLAKAGSSKRAVGLWLRGLSELNRLLVRDYILRVTGADPPLVFYPRASGDFLLVVVGASVTVDEVAKISTALGDVEKVYPEISVVEVQVNNERFVGGAVEKVTDKKDPAYYELNKKELESIDLQRVSRAVQRLADVEPKVYRSDITRKLIGLLGSPGVDFKGEICRALAVWSEHPGPAGDAALKEAEDLLARKVVIPKEMIALIVKEKNTGVIPVLDVLWSKQPTSWEALYGDLGPAAEATLILRFPNTDGMLRQSAVRLLGRVGGENSLPLLAAAAGAADPELKILIEKSTAEIRQRLAR